jgi:EAL domain-containing protein (putative c-di-GMP-specific phosphodiesterase class I)
LKIDQNFIRNITSNARSAVITTASIALGPSLGTTVSAEGVETQGQFDYLRQAS